MKFSREALKEVFLIAAIGFLLNVIWENAQAPLYQGYENFWQHFLICLPATFGDVLILWGIYGALAFVYKDWLWPNDFKKNRLLVLVILSFAVGVAVEKYALLTNRWMYNELMPIIPYLEVGLTPILQAIIIFPFTIFAAIFLKRF